MRRMKTHFGDRAFSAAGPRCWNILPPVIRFADSVDSFKAQLKPSVVNHLRSSLLLTVLYKLSYLHYITFTSEREKIFSTYFAVTTLLMLGPSGLLVGYFSQQRFIG